MANDPRYKTPAAFIESLQDLSDEPLRRAAQIALKAIDRTFACGGGNPALDAAYDAIKAALK